MQNARLKLRSRLSGEISITSDMQKTLRAENEEELKSLLMKVKEESYVRMADSCRYMAKATTIL